MVLGKNVNLPIDKLIRNTSHGSIVRNTGKSGKASTNPDTATFGKIKMTFFVEPELLQNIYNFMYWERIETVTQAVNIVLKDGLKNKNTKEKLT